MKTRKTILLLCLILSNGMFLCGCWNYTDIEDFSIVSGFAIDKNEQGDKYLLTIEIVDFEMVGKEAKQSGKYIEAEGTTIFDAVRNTINITGNKLYWSHANIAIISQDIAKEGLTLVLDFILRDHGMREEMYVLISKEKTAKEVLQQELLLSQTSTANIENMLKNQKNVGKALSTQAYQLVGDLESSGISGALPAIHLIQNSGKKTSALAGTAVFKSDKLVGYLDSDETRNVLFVKNKLDGGLITLNEDSTNQMDNVTFEIFRSKTKVKPEYSDKKLTVNIDIKTEVAIAEIVTTVDYINEKNRDKLKKDVEKKVKASVEETIKKVQQDYDTDIFGFGTLIKANIPSVWKGIEADWDKLFKQLEVKVKVDITFKNSDLMSKTIKKWA